jgi:uncharacterized BrkB/YihY/UPF0761 family membrane protein
MVTRIRATARHHAGRASRCFAAFRERFGIVETLAQVYERDRDAAGTLLGSAVAARLFLFMVPLMLFAVGTAGLIGNHTGFDSFSESVGVTGSMAEEIDAAFDQGGVGPWIAIGIGLLGIGTTGRSLTRSLVLSSALAWRLGGGQRTTFRVIGIVVGIVVALTFLSGVLNRIRVAAGLAVTSVSFVAVALVYLVLFSLLFLALPRGTTDPGAALPGAALVGVVVASLQAVTQLFIPGRIASASALYGTIGVALVVLGWFFVIGRVVALAFALNAVVFDRMGSVSRYVFAVPGLRTLPRRSPALARYFDLETHDPNATEP